MNVKPITLEEVAKQLSLISQQLIALSEVVTNLHLQKSIPNNSTKQEKTANQNEKEKHKDEPPQELINGMFVFSKSDEKIISKIANRAFFVNYGNISLCQQFMVIDNTNNVFICPGKSKQFKINIDPANESFETVITIRNTQYKQPKMILLCTLLDGMQAGQMSIWGYRADAAIPPLSVLNSPNYNASNYSTPLFRDTILIVHENPMLFCINATNAAFDFAE